MFEFWTLYTGAGLIVGLGVSLLAFSKWDLPAWLKRNLHLNTQIKGLFAVLLLGTLLAACTMAVTAALSLDPKVSQAIEGLVIGFNCALVTGLIGEQQKGRRSGSSSKTAAKRPSTDNRGRRSKG